MNSSRSGAFRPDETLHLDGCYLPGDHAGECRVDPPLTDDDYRRAASDMPEKLADPASGAYTHDEVRALLEVGVQNHGWYMTETEYRQVLAALGRFERLAEVAGDFLASEYPSGTDHPADAEADRLRRALEAVR